MNPFSPIVFRFEFVYIDKELWRSYIGAADDYDEYLEAQTEASTSESMGNFMIHEDVLLIEGALEVKIAVG